MENTVETQAGIAGRAKFIVGGLLIIAAIIYLIASSTRASAQYFLTIEELAEGREGARARCTRFWGGDR